MNGVLTVTICVNKQKKTFHKNIKKYQNDVAQQLELFGEKNAFLEHNCFATLTLSL